MLHAVLDAAAAHGPETAALVMSSKTREVGLLIALHPLMRGFSPAYTANNFGVDDVYYDYDVIFVPSLRR
jgi:hypothetical protein